MKAAILELLSSKKFLVLVATMIGAIAAHWGFTVDTEAVATYVLAPAAAWLVAQGIADHGKSAAAQTGATLDATIAGVQKIFDNYKAHVAELNATRMDPMPSPLGPNGEWLRPNPRHGDVIVPPAGAWPRAATVEAPTTSAAHGTSGAASPTIVVSTINPDPKPPGGV